MIMADASPSHDDFKALQKRILDAVTAGVPVPRPRRTRQGLERNYSADWDLDWFEAIILLNCSHQVRPARTHGLLGKLRRLRQKRGEAAVFDAFMERVDAILHPKTVTPHGYSITFGQQNATKVFDAIAQTARPLAQLEYPVFLYAGALLGYIRSGRLIDHDDDLDFGVFLGECSTTEASKRWLAYKRNLAELGLLSEEAQGSGSVNFKLKSDLPVDVDLFPAWTRDGKFSVYPYSLDALDEASVFPFKSFGQDPLMLPADPEALLAQSYGQDWRIPDPLFHLNWPAKKREFSELTQISYSLSAETA